MGKIKQLATVSNLSQVNRTGLPAEFWPDQEPTLVIPISHFDGRYPDCRHKPRCKTRWVISGQGDTAVSFTPVTFNQWRPYTTKSGWTISACKHCQHERTLSYCYAIERAAQQYAHPGMLCYLETTIDQAKKLADVIRKRNQREREASQGDKKGYSYNYTTFPLDDDKTIVLHDVEDLEGEPLPTNRQALFDLAQVWAMATPKGKRAGHGLGTWGKVTSGKGNSQEDKQGSQETSDKPKRWRLIGDKFQHVKTLFEAWLSDEKISVSLRDGGNKINIPAAAVIDFLEEAGIDYAIEGDNVTLNRLKENIPISAKCDNAHDIDGHKGIGEKEQGAAPPPLAFNLPDLIPSIPGGAYR